VRPRGDRRAALLLAAREVVLRFGFRKTGLGDVARQAGVSRATVYNYFPDKEALFKAIIAEETAQLARAVARGLDPTAPPADQLVAYVRARREQLQRVREVYVLTANIGRDVLGIAEEAIGSLRSQERAFLAGVLRAGVACGQFRHLDPDLTAAVLLSALRGLEEDFVFATRPDFAPGSDPFVQLLLVGLLAEPARATGVVLRPVEGT